MSTKKRKGSFIPALYEKRRAAGLKAAKTRIKNLRLARQAIIDAKNAGLMQKDEVPQHNVVPDEEMENSRPRGSLYL